MNKALAVKYLGSTIDASGDSVLDAKARARIGWTKWREATGILCDKKIPRRLKSKFYRSVIRPAMLYGSECRPSTVNANKILGTTETKMLRWILGLTLLDHVENDEVRRLMGVRPINDKIVEGRLRWFGHVERSDPNSVAHSAMLMDEPGTRERGRPKKTWMANIKDDLKNTGLTKEDAQDRAKWRRLSRRADPSTNWD